VTLAIGIGGNVAIFALVNSIVLSPLPYPQADRLVRVAADVPAIDAHGIEIPIGFWLGYRALSETFEEIGLYQHGTVNLSGEGEPERVPAIHATGSLFAALAAAPALGRPIVDSDEAPEAPPVALLSHRLWVRRYAADETLVGRTVQVDGIAREVIGVMPGSFAFPSPETQIWLPLTIDRGSDPPISFSYSSVGRLADGVALETATADLTRVTQRLPELFGNIGTDFLEGSGVAPSLRAYKDTVVGEVADTLWLLLGALGLLLLLACANVANLFLVRSEARRREVGLRAALGASGADLVRYVLSESLVIGALAGAAGLALAFAGVRALVVSGPVELPRLEEVGIGPAEVAFTAGVTLLVSLLFGALPMARLSSSRVVAQLGESDGRATGGRAARHATTLMVVAQVALALLLMVGAALFTRSLVNLTRIDPGFRAEGVLTFRLSLPEAAYPDHERRALFHQGLLDRIAALPGVTAAGVARCLPLQGWCGGNLVTSPDSPLSPEQMRDVASIKRVSAGYFDALGMTIVRGRGIERRDHEERTGAVVLSRALAERLFPGLDPIGKRVYPSEAAPADEAHWYTVVGVAGTVKRLQLDEEPADILYLPMLGTDDRFAPGLGEVVVAVRTSGDPLALAGAVRAIVRESDDNVPVAAVEPMTAVLGRATARVVFTTTLIGIAALAALLLGAVGIYGVVSHTVGRRTAEIGVRMALGARSREVLRMVLVQGMLVALAGIGVGLVGAVALGRLLRSLLYEVSPTDPIVLALVATGLLAVAILATWLPARRAAAVDPIIALKQQ
jgi:predicted permease